MRAFEPVEVLLKEGIAHDADTVGVFHQGLDNGRIVLAGVDPLAIIADRCRLLDESILIALLQGRQFCHFFCAAFHGEFCEGVTRSRCRWWTRNQNLHVRQVIGDILPGLVRILDPAALAIWQFSGERAEDFLLGQVEFGRTLGIGEHDTVIADLHFNELGDPGFRTKLDLGRFDRPRRIGNGGLVRANAIAEGLEPAACAGGLDNRGWEFRDRSELLRHGGRERRDGRRADNLDLLIR